MSSELNFILYFGLLLGSALAVSDRLFPASFKFGLATASYQVEGAWNEDGKGENIWDRITHVDPNYVAEQDNGDISCDSYHKYKEDVQLLKEIGADFYRFSLSWSRIIPGGVAGSAINPKGIEYYRNLSQELLDNGIEPLVTIFHWDTPQPLQNLGGFPSADIIEHYAYFVRVVFRELGDLVKNWLTFNEPHQTCVQGYGTGEKAPAITLSGIADYLCARNLLLAHARAYHIYQDDFKDTQGGKVGIVIDTPWFQPANDTEADREAAERQQNFYFGLFGNPIYNGNYPQVMIDRIDERSRLQGYKISRLPKFTPEEIQYIKGTYDVIAVNHYTANLAASQAEPDINIVSFDTDVNAPQSMDPDWPESASSWLRVTPWSIRNVVNWVSKTYGNTEIYITENGFTDRGGLEDDARIDFYREYLSNLLDAILEDKINVTHYTAWSLIDNFEWISGFTEKFGLYSVDFNDPNRTRTAKKSAGYYANVIKTRCLIETCVEDVKN